MAWRLLVGGLMRIDRFPLRVCVVLLGLAALATNSARAADCNVTPRELGGVRGAPSVSSAACPVAPGSSEVFHVTYLRLNEVLAGTLAMRETVPEIAPFFGDKGLVSNAVAQEIEAIFKRFGRKKVYPSTKIGLMMNARGVARSQLEWRSFEVRPQDAASRVRRLWTITHAVDSMETRFPIFDKSASTIIHTTDRWPQNYRMFYQCSDRSLYECITLWKFLEPNDLDTLARDTEEDERQRIEDGRQLEPVPKEAGKEASDWPLEAGEEVSDWPLANSYSLHFEYFKYLTRGGWHPKFAYLSIDATDKACGDTITSGYFTRPMTLDVALIENTSSKPLSIKGLLGTQLSDTVVRPVEADDKRQGAPSTFALDLTIEPGKKAVLPLRIVLLDPTKSMEAEDLRSVSAAMHRKVQAGRPKDLEYTVYEKGEERKGRKRANTFKAPELPALPDLVYGPSLRMRGLKIDASALQLAGENQTEVALTKDDFSFDQASENFRSAPEVHLVQNSQGMVSCPYLYTWDDREKTWVNNGKVIDSAEGPEKEAVERIRIEGDVRRIRLAEDEAEDAYIRDVRLLREYADGSTEELRAQRMHRGGKHIASDVLGMTAKIPAFSHVEFEFAAPRASAVPVVASTFEISGYYVRHSTLQAPRIVRDGLR